MKRKNKALYMWAALTTLVVAGVALDYMWERRMEDQKSESSRALQIESAQVNELDINLEAPFTVTKDSQAVMTNKLQLVKSSEGWMLKSPVEELADQDTVRGYVEWLTKERLTEVKAETPVVWKNFGLEQPKASIQVKDDQGRAYLFAVSSKKNFEGDAYVRKDAEDKVFLGSAMWFTNVEKNLNDFRDKRILKVPVADIKSFQFRLPKGLIAFERKDKDWILESKPEWKLDQNEVRALLGALTGNLALDFKREGAIKKTDLKEFGLEKAPVSVEVEVAEGRTWTANISARNDMYYYVHVNDPSEIVSLNVPDGEKLTALTVEQFRDRKAPFEIDRDKLKSIELKKANLSLKATKGVEGWKVDEKPAAGEVTPKMLSELVDRLRNLEVAEYSPKAEGSNKGEAEVVLKDEAGSVMFSLSIGALTRLKTKNDGQREVRLAQSSLSPEPISIDADQFEALKLGRFFGEQATESKK